MSQMSLPDLAERKYVDDRDLARLTPISRAHWQAMRVAGEGPPWRKLGRRVVYEWADVVAWIEKQPGSANGAKNENDPTPPNAA